MKATYKIPEFNWENLQEKIQKVNNKCKKLGFAEIKITLCKTDFVTHPDYNFVYKVYTIEIDGETPKIDNWEFLATLEHTEMGNVVRNISGNEIPEIYRAVKPMCEHCNVNRFRIDTFLLKNTITGNYKQVGRNCLADFLGGKNPHNIALYCEYLKDIKDCAENDDEGDFFKGGNRRYFEVADIIKNAVYNISKHGYIKKVDAEEMGKISTFHYVTSTLYKVEKSLLISDDEVQKMMEWVKKSIENNEYINNLKVLCANEFCEYRDIGILISLPVAYRRFLDRDKEKKETKTSEFIGVVGEKLTVTAKLEKSIAFETQWGMSYINLFKDVNENVIKWGTSIGLTENVNYELIGKVKSQEIYKGVKQTELTRCKYAEK
jgi:hypothetical protein